MRRARNFQALPSSSEDENDFEEKDDFSEGTSNLSSRYDYSSDDEEGGAVGEEEDAELEVEEFDDDDDCDDESLTTAPSNSTASTAPARTRDRNNRRNNTRSGGLAARGAATRRRRDDDVSSSDIDYDSSESAMSGDVRVGGASSGNLVSSSSAANDAARGTRRRRRRRGDPAATHDDEGMSTLDRRRARAMETRRLLLGDNAVPRRFATAASRRGAAVTNNANSSSHNNTNSTRGSRRNGNNNDDTANNTNANDEGEFVPIGHEDVIEDFDSMEDDDDDDDSSDDDSSSSGDNDDDNSDDDSISDDDADFQETGDTYDEDMAAEDEDEEEENVLFDLSERLGGAGASSAQNSVKPLLQVVRTIIRMEKAHTAKADALKALETRRQSEAVVNGDGTAADTTTDAPAADNTNDNNTTNTTSPTDATTTSPSDAQSSPQEAPLDEQIADLKAFLAEVKPLLTDQWAIATRLLYTEFLRANDAYSQTLDFTDRGPFERLTRILLGREELFEIIDGHLLVGDMNADIPRYAAFIAYMVGEGTREPVFGATAQDLFPIVLSDPSRLKRIVALTSLFTLLDKEYEEERTITDLLGSDVPRALLMRIRDYYPQLMAPFTQHTSSHLMNYNTTSADEGSDIEGGGFAAAANNFINSSSDLHGILSFASSNNNPSGAAAAAASPATAEMFARQQEHLQQQQRATAAAAAADGDEEDDDAFAPPDLALPQTDSIFATSVSGSGVPPNASALAAGLRQTIPMGPYIPKVGDIVVRGPEWTQGEQDHGCKRGVVMAILSKGIDGDEDEIEPEEDEAADNNGEDDDDDDDSDDEGMKMAETYTVLVRWDPDDDLSGGTTKRRINKHLRGKLYKYRCGGYTHREVVSLEEYRRINMFDLDAHDFKHDEFYLMTAIVGVLSHKKPMVSLIVEHHTLEAMVAMLHSGLRYGALVQDIVLSRISNCELESDEEALEFPWCMAHLLPPAVEKAVRSARTWRELTARAVWVLNGAVTHKTLGSMFLRLDGLQHVLALANSYPSVVSHRYGCGLVLSQISKAQLLSEVVAAGEHLLPQFLSTCQKLLENSNNDIKQAVAMAYYCGLSYVPFLRQFDIEGGISGIIRELKTALGLQGHSNALLPADQRPVEIDMFINKNAHLINIYLRAIFVYLGSHLLQLGIALFRRQRSFGGVDRMAMFAGDSQFLPRDDNALETVIAALHQPDEYSDPLLDSPNRSSLADGGVNSTNGTPMDVSPSLGASAAPSSHHINNSRREYVAHSLISQEQWKYFRHLVEDLRLHELLLLIVHTFETHRKRDVRMSALNVLYVLAVAPCTRTPIAECFIESPDSIDEFRASAAASAGTQKHRGLKVLLQVTEESDLTGKEAVLANVKALNVLALLLIPPLSVVTGYNIASFDRITGAAGLVGAHHAMAAAASGGVGGVGLGSAVGLDAATAYANICSLFRACDGVKTLLALKLPSSDANASELANLMPLHFHMFAAQVFIFTSLRYFGDTPQLFSVLGVRKLAVDLQQYFRHFRQQSANENNLEPLTVRTFMNNCLSLATGSATPGFGGATHNMMNTMAAEGVGGGSMLDGDNASPHRQHGSGPSGVVGVGGAQGGVGSVTSAGGVVVGGAANSTHHFDTDGQERQFVIEHAHLDYNKDSLLELIARHLQSEGLVQAADILRREADLPAPLAAAGDNAAAAPSSGNHITTPATANSNGELPRGSSPLLTTGAGGAASHRSSSVPMGGGHNTATANNNAASTAAAAAASAQNQNPTASLDGIIRSYLRQTQEACPRPIATLPKIDLLRTQPIVGFDYSAIGGSAGGAGGFGMNAIGGGGIFGSYGLGGAGAVGIGAFTGFRGVTPNPTSLSNRLLNRKLGMKAWNSCMTRHYQQFQRNRLTMYDLRNTSNDDFDLAVVDFCDFGESLIAAGTDGTIVIFSHLERGTAKETHFLTDDSETQFMDVAPDCQSIIAINRDGKGKVLRRECLSSASNLTFDNANAAVFAPSAHRIAATLETDDVKIIDAITGGVTDVLTGMEGASNNHLNVAVFDISSSLVLNHGTLFDLRQANRPVFRFDCVSEHFSNIFHPSGLSTVVDGNLWDLRTMSTVASCPALLNTVPQYGRIGGYFYAPVINTEASRPSGIVNVVDTHTLNVVTTFQLDAHLETFALDVFTENSFATINECADADKVLKVYQIGRHSDQMHSALARQLAVPSAMEENDDDLLDDLDDEEDEEDLDDMTLGDDEEDDLYNMDDSDEDDE